jgi:hypothetical protein
MALLGTWIDRTSAQTLGGSAGNNGSFQTVPHFVATIGSGPAASTNPDTGIIVIRSVQGSLVATNPGVPIPYYFGANASIATLGLAIIGSAAPSIPIIAVDVFNVYFWNPIR